MRTRQADEEDVPRKYLFIDGAFFRSFIDEMKTKAEADHGSLDIQIQNVGSGYDRVFFYDAFPERKDGQLEAEFAAELEDAERYFKTVSEARNFSVRPALTRRGKRREQKGVDVLLAIECLMHAIRNNIDEAAIMTSDLDFFPLFEALLQTRTKSLLRYQLGKTSDALVQAADFAEPVTAVDFFDWLQPENQGQFYRKGVTLIGAERGRECASGTVAGKEFRLMHLDDPEGYVGIVDKSIRGQLSNSRLLAEGLIEKAMKAGIEYTTA